MQVRKKNKNDIIGSKVWRRMLAYLLAGTLIGVEFPSQIQAQDSRAPEAQSAKESTENKFVAVRSQIVSSPAIDLGILRLEAVGVEAADSSVRPVNENNRAAFLNNSKYLSALYRPRFSADAMKDFRLPVEPQPQPPSGKKSKAAGLVQGLFGLALAGGGWYWAAKSEPYEIVTPGFTYCTGIMANGCVKTSPRRTKTGVNLGMYAGIGLVGFGVGVAIAGFRRM